MDIPIQNFIDRRNECIQKMKEISKDSKACMILYSPPERLRNGDNYYKYRFGSDVFYLSGLKDQGVILVLSTEEPHSTAFVLPKDPEKEVWTGIRRSFDEIINEYGFDSAESVYDIDSMIPKLLYGCKELFISFMDEENALYELPDIIKSLSKTMSGDADINKEIRHILSNNIVTDSSMVSADTVKKIKKLKSKRKSGATYPYTIRDAHSLIAEMRKYKNKNEIEAIKRCVEITNISFQNTMRFTKPGMSERDIEAYLEYEYKKNGGEYPGFESITAGGENATILHYISNDRVLKDNTLLLIDSGVEKDGYTSDISRTFPVGKSFTDTQKAVYQSVLDLQKKIIDYVKPGVTMKELNKYSTELIIQALINLGVLKGDVETHYILESYKPFYMHGIGHYLGIDVHDVGSNYKDIGKDIPLSEGAVITIEPGLYFGKTAQEYTPKELYGIGIRIEDNILITKNGNENLSKDIPKEISELEAIKRD